MTFFVLGIVNDDWGKQKPYVAILLTDCTNSTNFFAAEDLMSQNLTKLNLTLQYCQPIEKGKLTASEDEAMKMQQIFG